MQIHQRHRIGTDSAPGELVLCESYGSFYVAYQAPSGSTYPRTRNLKRIADAAEAFSHIVETENWNGIVHTYA